MGHYPGMNFRQRDQIATLCVLSVMRARLAAGKARCIVLAGPGRVREKFALRDSEMQTMKMKNTMGKRLPRQLAVSIAGTAMLGLAACSSGETQYAYPDDRNRKGSGDMYQESDRLFGQDSLSLFGDSNDGQNQGGGGSGIAVNSFLWRASLDTVSFLPLISADPFGGVIITDWHVAPEAPDERVKMQIYILDRQLRSDGVRVAVFREAMEDGRWVTKSVSERTAQLVEDNILARARELRVNSNGSSA